jgi:hypothetical protein
MPVAVQRPWEEHVGSHVHIGVYPVNSGTRARKYGQPCQGLTGSKAALAEGTAARIRERRGGTSDVGDHDVAGDGRSEGDGAVRLG